jgi:hypothetical protein
MRRSSSTDNLVPYAPPANVLSIIHRQRAVGLPETLDTATLNRIGIPTGMENKSIRALQHLGLIDGDGVQLDAFRLLRNASTEEYPNVLAQLVRSAYSDVFTVVDPTQATAVQINDAFRGFEPAARRARMVTLFLALCREAQIIADSPARSSSAPRPPAEKRPAQRRERKQPNGAAAEEAGKTDSSQKDPKVRDGGSEGHRTELEQLFNVLLRRIPEDGVWSQDERDRWLAAFGNSLDVFIKVQN